MSQYMKSNQPFRNTCWTFFFTLSKWHLPPVWQLICSHPLYHLLPTWSPQATHLQSTSRVTLTDCFLFKRAWNNIEGQIVTGANKSHYWLSFSLDCCVTILVDTCRIQYVCIHVSQEFKIAMPCILLLILVLLCSFTLFSSIVPSHFSSLSFPFIIQLINIFNFFFFKFHKRLFKLSVL